MKQRRENKSLANAKILSKREKIELGMAVYLFYGEEDSKNHLCATEESHSGNLNTKHVKLLMNKWKGIAFQLSKLDIHAILCTGYVRAGQMFYHKSHLIQFHNFYRSLQSNNEDPDVRRSNFLLQCYAWREILNHIYHSTEQFIEVIQLEKNIYFGIEKILKKIQEKLNIKNEFCGTLDKELAVPAELLVLLNLLMVGNSSDETGFFLQVKTIAQINLFNHKNENESNSTTDGSKQWHKADRGSPIDIYI